MWLSFRQVFLLISVLVVLLSYAVLNLKTFLASEEEQDLDHRSFLWAKVSYALVPSSFPQNSTFQLYLPRAFMRYTSYLSAYVMTLREPDLLQIPYEDVDIEVPASYLHHQYHTPASGSSATGEKGSATSKIQIRIYNHNRDRVQKPVLVWYHGGGWVLGDMPSDHAFCLRFAKELDFIIVNVDYRLAPEYVFPTAIEDSYQAFRWVVRNIHQYGGDKKRVILAGESAGGNLASAVMTKYLHEKEKKGIQPIHASPVIGLYLVYPVLAPFSNLSSPNVMQYAKTSGMLSLQSMENMRALYSGSRNATVRYNDLYAPLLTPDATLKCYPPTLFVLAKYDVLTEESEIFAKKLRQHNIAANILMYNSSIHAFFGRELISPVAPQALKDSTGELLKLLKVKKGGL